MLLRLSYEGTAYAGWQAQDNALAVQPVLERAIFGITGERLRVTGASRTDAGVHALSQAAHFDTASRVPAEKFALALNTRLPQDVRVTASREVPEGFHAALFRRGKGVRLRLFQRGLVQRALRQVQRALPRAPGRGRHGPRRARPRGPARLHRLPGRGRHGQDLCARR